MFLQLHPCSDSDYNLIYILEVKICGYKHSAMHLKNQATFVCTFFPQRMLSHFIPEKAHVLLPYLPRYSLWFLFGFSPFFLLLQGMSDFKGLFFHALHPQDHVSQQLVLRPKSERSHALFRTMEISLRGQMKIHSFRSRTKRNNSPGAKKLPTGFLNCRRF